MDSQKEEGPAPLLWRFSDFLKWAELCPSDPEIGHALMRLVITGQEIPHECEVYCLLTFNVIGRQFRYCILMMVMERSYQFTSYNLGWM